MRDQADELASQEELDQVFYTDSSARPAANTTLVEDEIAQSTF